MHRMTAVGDVDRKEGRPDRARLWSGLLGGALVGALVWVAYFVQASTTDRYSWEAMVVPALAVAAVGSLVVGTVWPRARRTSVGVALGAISTLPLVLGAFLVVFLAFGLE